jgi:hypothetical protein
VSFVDADLLDLHPDMLGADAPVDAVFSTATFHWVTDHDRLSANLAVVLRPGGQRERGRLVVGPTCTSTNPAAVSRRAVASGG